MSISVKVESNLDEAKLNFEYALAQWAEGVGAALIDMTQRDVAHRGTPVDTGRLARSMTSAKSKDNKTVYVGTDVEYAIYVEEGARGREGAHMLRNAVMDSKDFAKDWLEFVLEANA